MMKRSICAGALAVAMVAPAFEAMATEPLTTAELSSHCTAYPENPESAEAKLCIAYIQGFIDGAIVTDERVAENVAKEDDETFAERAIRTRLGPRLKHKNPSFYAEFCLGAPVPLKEITDRIIHDLLDRDFVSDEQRANQVVYRTLREQYPCSEED
jgi:Rap1a immunity proteins